MAGKRKIRVNYQTILASMQPADRQTVLSCANQLEEKLDMKQYDCLELLAKIGAHLQNGNESESKTRQEAI
jgi:hypothetical protein